MSAVDYEVRTPDGMLLGTAGNLIEARRLTLPYPGRALVLHGGAIVDWARGIGPGDRAAAETVLRKLGLVSTPAPARLTSCDRCGKTLPARAESPTCGGCRDRAARRAQAAEGAAPNETQSPAPEEPVSAAKPAAPAPKATQSAAPKATCDHPDGCVRPAGKTQANTRPERRGWCKEHRQHASWNEDRRERSKNGRAATKPAPKQAAKPKPAKLVAVVRPARKSARAATPVPARVKAAPAVVTPAPKPAAASVPDVRLSELLEAHALVCAIGFDVCRGLAARIDGARS